MKKILFINACVRPKSRTYKLAKSIVDKMSGTVEEVNLEKADIDPLNWASLQERDAYSQNKDFSAAIFKYARQFVEADEIVIAAPYWDLSFPASLRVYIEAASVCGLSFEYTEEGQAKGLCKAKRIIYVTTAGGTIGEYNLGYDYIKAVAQAFYGIPDVLCYKLENLDIIGSDVDKMITEAIESIKQDERI